MYSKNTYNSTVCTCTYAYLAVSFHGRLVCIMNFTLSFTETYVDPSPPSLGVGSRISVNIEPSDDAYGIFSFALGSISVVTMEGVDDLTLNVTRSGGSLSAVIVNWVVGGNASDDVVPGSGSIVFGEGVTVEGIELSIVNDMVSVCV